MPKFAPGHLLLFLHAQVRWIFREHLWLVGVADETAGLGLMNEMLSGYGRLQDITPLLRLIQRRMNHLIVFTLPDQRQRLKPGSLFGSEHAACPPNHLRCFFTND
jgi:hypothetical protein